VYIGTVEYSDCTILEKLEYLARFFPERAAALYEPKECLTYGDLWSLSGKIYAYLKKRGVGP
jgi:acyl-CoA synthetase (AMP-forming)/AMP-acid ligase II